MGEGADLGRLSNTIATSLVTDIREGAIQVGSPLPTERELAVRFDTSRPTIREALTQMQLRGFLDAGVGRRPRAARPSIHTILTSAGQHIRDLLGDAESGAHLEQTRMFIESGAVREAAKRRDSIQIARLQDRLGRNEAAIGSPHFAQTDIAFHRELVRIVGNPVILTLHDMFVTDLLAQRSPVDDPAVHDAIAHDEHRRIFEAVVDGDVAKATDVMEHHLTRSYEARLRMRRVRHVDSHPETKNFDHVAQ